MLLLRSKHGIIYTCMHCAVSRSVSVFFSNRVFVVVVVVVVVVTAAFVVVVCLATAIDACHFLAWHLLTQKVITVFCHGDR